MTEESSEDTDKIKSSMFLDGIFESTISKKIVQSMFLVSCFFFYNNNNDIAWPYVL